MRSALASGFLCGLVALSLPVSGAEERWRKVKGASLQSLFQDKEFGDGVHFECYLVQQDGVHVRLMLNGSEAWYGTLQKVP